MGFDLEHFPTSPIAIKMLSYVTTGWYDKSYVGKWLYQVMGTEMDRAQGYVDELVLQLFPETATWGICYHEIKFGLDIRTDLTLEERRQKVIEKRDTKAPMTPWRMETILNGAVGCEVSVSDVMDGAVDNHPNIFDVVLSGESTEWNISKAIAVLNGLKQSHTLYNLYLLICRMELTETFNPGILYRMSVSWWGKVLDGSCLLDGSEVLNSVFPPYFVVKDTFTFVETARFIYDRESWRITPINETDRYIFRQLYKETFSWWGNSLDGSLLLNGSKLLDAEYPPFFNTFSVVFDSPLRESVDNEPIYLMSVAENHEYADFSERERLYFYWNADKRILNGEEKLDGSSRLDADQPPEIGCRAYSMQLNQNEQFPMTMYTPSKDVPLDGCILLDGNIKMNSGREEL